MKRMNEKGLTLIELLAVVVVLSLLAIVTVPVISGVINKTRYKAFVESANGILESSKLYYTEHQNNSTVRFDKNDEKNTLKRLSYKGQMESGTVIVNKKGKVALCVHDGKYSAYKNYEDNKLTFTESKNCYIPENTFVVYLDPDGRTVDDYTNEELTEIVEELREQISSKPWLNDIYPVGSIYTSTCGGTTDTTCLKTVEEVEAKLGGKWEVYGDGRVLKSSTDESGKTGGNNSVTLAANQIPSLSTSGTAASAGAHTHTVSGSAASAGAHTHSVSTSGGNHSHSYSNPTQSGYYAAVGSNYGVVTGGNTSTGYSGNLSMSGTAASAGAHTHTVSGSAATAGAHTHTVTASYTNNNQQSVNVQNKYITAYMYKRIA